MPASPADKLNVAICPGCVKEIDDSHRDGGSCPHCDYEFDRERFPTMLEAMHLQGELNNVSPKFLKEIANRLLDEPLCKTVNLF